MQARLLLKNARQIVCVGGGRKPKIGADMNKVYCLFLPGFNGFCSDIEIRAHHQALANYLVKLQLCVFDYHDCLSDWCAPWLFHAYRSLGTHSSIHTSWPSDPGSIEILYLLFMRLVACRGMLRALIGSRAQDMARSVCSHTAMDKMQVFAYLTTLTYIRLHFIVVGAGKEIIRLHRSRCWL